jgi:two-component system nitrate/nitrite response regulator NarL
MAKHLFLSDTGEMLPHWQKAFPGAETGRPGQTSDSAPDLVWLRLNMDSAASVQLGSLRERFAGSACIVMSDIPGDEEALAAFVASARGYCNSHASPKVLRQAADVVLQGGLWIGESVMRRLVSLVEAAPAGKQESPGHWAAPLTDREKQVAEAIAAGASNKEIARQLAITERTVKAHVGSILDKLQVRDRLQLALLIKGHQKAI